MEQKVDVEIPEEQKRFHDLVVKYAADGRYEDAERVYNEALKDLTNTYGRIHPEVATMLNVLALIYRDQKKYDKATELLNESLEIRKTCFGGEHAAVAATLNNLAVLHGKSGKFNDAEILCKQALTIRQNLHGSNHSDIGRQLNNLALICQHQRKFDEAKAYYFRAIEIFKNDETGTDDLNIAKTKTNLATVFLKEGKYKEAENVYKEVISNAYENEFGQISETNNNKPIWKIAEDCESFKGQNAQTYPGNYDCKKLFGGENGKPLQTAIKNLSILYRREEKFHAAETLENALKI